METVHIDNVVGKHTGLSRAALEYTSTMQRVVSCAKRPHFSCLDWTPLEQFVAVAEFQRVGNFKEVMNWQEYIAFLTCWASVSEWTCSFRRITERSGVVYLELVEHSRTGHSSTIVNSISVYEFDDFGKIRHLDVYLQMQMPSHELLDSYSPAVIDRVR